jgi:cell division protein FtsI/penicillin-binding protein 2
MDVMLTLALITLAAVVSALITWLLCARRLAALTLRAVIAEASLEAERNAQAEKVAAIQANEQQLCDAFKSLSADTVRDTREQVLQLAQDRFERQQQTATSSLDQLIKPRLSCVAPALA